jgi:hypothetical protein
MREKQPFRVAEVVACLIGLSIFGLGLWFMTTISAPM